jgi:RimJ/RimL family protein N-acetyltransferase
MRIAPTAPWYPDRVGHMEGVLRTERLDLLLLDTPAARRLVTCTRRDGEAWAPGYPLGSSLLGAELTLAAAAKGQPLGSFGSYQVLRRADATVIGDAGFMGPPDATGAVSVGCAITDDARRRGYATEALAALLAWARDQPGLTCVLADTTRTNVASQRLLDRVGMLRVGEDGELLYYML